MLHNSEVQSHMTEKKLDPLSRKVDMKKATTEMRFQRQITAA